MGYRNFIGLVDKGLLSEVRHLSIDVLNTVYGKEGDVDGNTIFRVYDIEDRVIHEFGTLSKVDSDRIIAGGELLFTNEGTQKAQEYYEAYVIGKQGLLNVIELYRDKVIAHFENLLVDDSPFALNPSSSSEKSRRYVEGMLRDWTCEMNSPILLHEKWDEISNSHRYEYYIFELVRQLKTIDFNQYDLIFYGY